MLYLATYQLGHANRFYFIAQKCDLQTLGSIDNTRATSITGNPPLHSFKFINYNKYTFQYKVFFLGPPRAYHAYLTNQLIAIHSIPTLVTTEFNLKAGFFFFFSVRTAALYRYYLRTQQLPC